jgi:hypothetical protein
MAQPQTETKEHLATQKALDRLTQWGKNPGPLGGENITFSVSRQGSQLDTLFFNGDCSLFTPSGYRGTLNGQAPGNTGAPVAYIPNYTQNPPTVNQVPCTFSFDLNAGKVTLNGAFPGLPATLDFTVEYIKDFDANAGENMLFHSEKTSDNAGYILSMELVGAS